MVTSSSPFDDYAAFTVGEQFRVVPPGAPELADDRVNLVIARGAFGSGEHETTAACLELLGELHRSASAAGPCDNSDGPRPVGSGDALAGGGAVLDLGSGTGILAIAALRLGAGFAVCVDTDAAAVAVARRNCALNGVQGRVAHIHGPLAAAPPGPFDLVLANVDPDVLRAEARSLVARARGGAPVLLSGIPTPAVYDLRVRYEGLGCRCLSERWHAEFGTLLLVRSE
jgi:ribosomal protein L11 methyltransferase